MITPPILTHLVAELPRLGGGQVHVDHPPALLGELGPGLGVGVVHGEVGDDDRDGQGHNQHPCHGTHGTHEHAQVGLGHHVPVPHRGHRHQGPPQPQGDGGEVIGWVDLDSLSIIDKAGKDDNTEDQEEYEEHQLLGRGTKCLKEDLQTRGMTGELEEPEYPDDAEELEDISILDMGDMLLEEEVGVETDGGNIVNNIHGGFEEIAFVGAGNESERDESDNKSPE